MLGFLAEKRLYPAWYGEGEAELEVGGTTGSTASQGPMGSISIAAVRVSLQWQCRHNMKRRMSHLSALLFP